MQMMVEQWMGVAGAVLFAALLTAIALTWKSRRTPGFPGRDGFAGLMLSAALWCVGELAAMLPLDPGTGRIAAALTWLPMLCTPAFWLWFTWQYLKGDVSPLPRSWLLPQLVMVILTVGMALTNEHHHFFAADGAHGPWFTVALSYYYGLMLLGGALLFEAVFRSRGVYRRQYAVIAVAMALPWAASIGYDFGGFRPFGLDTAPIGFLIMGLAAFEVIARKQLFNLVPIARSILVDAIPDPVLVLDRSFEVVDANAAAFALAGVTQTVIGRRLSDVSVIGVPLAGFETGGALPTELSFGQPERNFEVNLIPLQHAGYQVGTLLMLRDVTRRARLETRLREQATRDTLTGLHNRRLLDEIGSRLVIEANQKAQPLAVIMIDLDHFKRLNDHYGHRAGDLVLRTIGGFLLERVRQTDFVFRTGGEEILIFLPGANAAQALSRIEEWRREFTTTEIAIGAEGRVRTTFSAGIAIYPDDGEDLDRVLLHADKALYRAKDRGRNCACLWQEPVPLFAGKAFEPPDRIAGC